MTWLGDQDWLDRPSYRLENVLTFGFNAFGGARNQVTNALNGVWLGHPVHPPLASLSSGVLSATVALDTYQFTVGRRTRTIDASHLAQHTLALGILANLGAAVTGTTDWQHTHEQDRRIGLVHGMLNLTATAMYALSWTERRRRHHLRAALISCAGYALSMSSGVLGGHLVFASKVGTDQSGPQLESPQWVAVMPQDSLPDTGLHRVEVDNVGVVMFRSDDEIRAVGEFCPHLAAPMADGWLDRGRVVCPWHGSQFDSESGEVVRGPASAPLPCYQARIRNGVIEVRATSEQPVDYDTDVIDACFTDTYLSDDKETTL
ncbi:(2Fe-2S)-binding protein [Mycobacterium sp. GA-1841]|nr:(2Fe-2S)-binding protein [Mycobacterium sp. GA-1841]